VLHAYRKVNVVGVAYVQDHRISHPAREQQHVNKIQVEAHWQTGIAKYNIHKHLNTTCIMIMSHSFL
jgi:hypothetical protein